MRKHNVSLQSVTLLNKTIRDIRPLPAIVLLNIDDFMRDNKNLYDFPMLNVKYVCIFVTVISLLAQVFIILYDMVVHKRWVSTNKIEHFP